MIDNLNALRNLDIFLNGKIIFYGAGVIGDRVGSFIRGSGIPVIAYTDRDEKKWNTKRFSYPVLSIRDMLKAYHNDDEVIIVITSSYLKEIADELLEMGVDENRIFSSFSLMYSVFIHVKDKRIDSSYREEFEKKYKYWSSADYQNYTFLHGKWHYMAAWSQFFVDNPILVYQFGKVGSSSVTQGLRRLGIHTLQTHALAYEKGFMDQEMHGMYSLFKKTIGIKDEVRIISMVREPVKRDFSFVFQHLMLPYISIYNDLSGNFSDDVLDIIYNKIVMDLELTHELNPVDFHFKYKLRGMGGNIFDWFDNELKQVFGIDVLELDFDKKNGYGVYQKGNIKFLLLKLEQLSQNERVIADFIGNQNYRLIDDNRAMDKPYYFTYNNVYRQAKLTMEYLNRYLSDNDHFNKFYNYEDLKKYIQTVN